MRAGHPPRRYGGLDWASSCMSTRSRGRTCLVIRDQPYYDRYYMEGTLCLKSFKVTPGQMTVVADQCRPNELGSQEGWLSDVSIH